ncbi:TonB-dependent siderophore receptor [Methylobacillus flagellatus]|uniref:TonB-dependent siderophore receptor n=1 Tax=Methylobacillus flagellatus TaxID=405 RepID=UPI0010F5CC2A|nr:TonB-dependent siderophore receptor [Methylobacillus flagellatus]
MFKPNTLHLAVLMLLSAPAQAAPVAPPADVPAAAETLPEVTVKAVSAKEKANGPVQGYAAKQSATATKTDTPLNETPQSVSVVTREFMEDLGAQNMQDALNYAAGVRSDAFGVDSRSDGYLVRGAYPTEYRDGLRRLFGFYTSTIRIDPYALERIEVLRGPASVLYGQGSTAGIVNAVSKMPQAEAQNEIGVQLGSFNRKQIRGDFTGPLNEEGTLLYRLVAVGRDADSQVDHVNDDRVLIAPSITYRPNDDTSFTLRADYQKDKSGSTLQFLPWSGYVTRNPNGRIPTDRFIGEPGNDRYDSTYKAIGWQFEHRFSDAWTVRQNFRYSDNEVDYRSLYADSFSNPGNSYLDPNQRIIGRYAYAALTKARNLTADQHLQGDFATGFVRHKLLLGLDYVHFDQSLKTGFDAPVGQGGGVPDIDVYNPVYTGYKIRATNAAPDAMQRQVGFYVQDQMKFGPNWIVVAGLRRDRAYNAIDGGGTEQDAATTGRLALMYAADNGLSPYISYSESFTPVTGTNFIGQRFTPMEGKQHEVGVKYQPVNGHYSLTAAVYDLRENNRLINDPNNPLNQIQAGKTQTSGLELSWLGRITPRMDVAAHYNYIENDKALDGIPEHQAAIWSKYRFSIADIDGFSAGLGARYFSSFRDTTAPSVDAVLLGDAMLGWENSNWRYALNAQNLTDEKYVSTCLGRGDCFVGARRSVLISATYRW